MPLPPPAPPSRSAAHEAYMITEIRQQILHQLERSSLASFMRVQKACLIEVAELLYRNVTQWCVRKVGSSTDRGQTHITAVRVITAEMAVSDSPTLEQLEIGMFFNNDHAWHFFGTYTPRSWESDVLPPRANCPNYRKLEFGRQQYGNSSWVVDHNALRVDTSDPRTVNDDSGSRLARAAGRSSIRKKIFPYSGGTGSFNLTDEGDESSGGQCFPCVLPGNSLESSPSELPRTRTPFSQSGLHPPHPVRPLPHGLRFPDRVDAGWTEAVMGGDLSNHCKAVSFDEMPITVHQLGSLYERQIAAGQSDRTEMISAGRIASYTLDHLESFAQIASTSLLSLDIASEKHAIPLLQVSALDTILRDHLPRLRQLHIGVDFAEAADRTLFSPTLLEPGGRLQKLLVIASNSDDLDQQLDLLRFISPMVTSSAEVGTRVKEAANALPGLHAISGGELHVGLLLILQSSSQPPHRRVDLSTVAFRPLGFSYQPVCELEYDEHDRPRSRLQSEAARWSEIADNPAPREVLAELCGTLDEVAAASTQVKESTVSESPLETSGKLRRLLDSVWELDEVADCMKEIAEERRQMARDVEVMIRVLEPLEEDEDEEGEEAVKEGDGFKEACDDEPGMKARRDGLRFEVLRGRGESGRTVLRAASFLVPTVFGLSYFKLGFILVNPAKRPPQPHIFPLLHKHIIMSNIPSYHPPEMSARPSLARELYEIREIRQEILQYLPCNDLAAFIRVEKECVGAVIRELYQVAPRSVVLREGVPEKRNQMYLKAITTIYFDEPYLSHRIQKDTTGSALFFEIASLPRKCPKLRRLEANPMLSKKEARTWFVDFHQSSGHTGSSIDGQVATGANISYHLTAALWAPDCGPGHLDVKPFSSPSTEYTVRTRFDLTLDARPYHLQYRPIDPIGDQARLRWLEAIPNDAIYAHLHRVLRLGPVPLPLPQIASLYQRQMDAGYSDRLSDIYAPMTPPWRLEHFSNFAQLASTSLSSLILADKEYPHGGYRHPLITLADLPGINALVREYLPNLRKLHIRVGKSTNPEAECGGRLSPALLEEGGTITDLLVITPTDGCSFNTVRFLAPLVTATATVGIAGEKSRGMSIKVQTAFLQYLKQQPHERRIHLAMVDFPALGIPTLDKNGLRSILGLAYADNGQPLVRIESEAIRWRASASAARAPASLAAEFAPQLVDAVSNAAEAAARVEDSSIGSDDARTLADMRALLARTEEAQTRRKEIIQILTDEALNAESMRLEVSHSIKLLEEQLARGN